MLSTLVRRVTGKPQARALGATVNAFLDTYENEETRDTYRKALCLFVQVIGDRRLIDSITPEDVDAWRNELREHDLAAATVEHRVKSVKTFWIWCVKREYIEKSPARFLTVKRYKRNMTSKAIPTDVLTAMFEAVQQKGWEFSAVRDTAILALLITFGARVGDVARLKLSDVTEDGQINFHVKGGKDHALPLPPETWQHLAAWLKMRADLDPDPAHEYMFVHINTSPGNRYSPLATGSISSMIKRLSEQVCERAYGPHSIRHWRGQTLADQRIAPTVVQAILGHSDVKITLEHYYNQDRTRVQRVLDSYELGHGLDQMGPGAPIKAATGSTDRQVLGGQSS